MKPTIQPATTPSLWSYALSKELIDTSTHQIVRPTLWSTLWRGRFIRLGGTILSSIVSLIHTMRKPSSVAATTIVIAAMVTLAFYPSTAIWVIPALKSSLLAFHHLLYITCQITLLSLGACAWNRFSDESLMSKWKLGEIDTVSYWIQ